MYTHLFTGSRKFLGGTRLFLLLFLVLGACGHSAVSANMASSDIASADAPSASMQAAVTQSAHTTSKTSIALYHEIWEIAGQQFHDVTDLTNWSQWEHKFDSQINSDADAITFANQMLGSLKDQYTYALDQKSTEQYHRYDDGVVLGIGIRWAFHRDTRTEIVRVANVTTTTNNTGGYFPFVLQVFANSPADKAGIKAGDEVVAINGLPINESPQQFLNDMGSRQLGQNVYMTLLHEGKPFVVSLAVAYTKAPATYTHWSPGNFGVIALYNFDQSSVQKEMADALIRFKNANGLVLDLRGNPGGYTETALKVISMIIKKGTIVTFANRVPGDMNRPVFQDVRIELTSDKLVRVTTMVPGGQPKPASESRQVYLLNGKPLVVLVDRSTASASEICTGAVQDNEFDEDGHRHYWVLGSSNTFGKGIGQTVNSSLPDKTLLKVTSFEWRTPAGRWAGNANANRPGLIPDMVVPSNNVFQLYSDEDIPYRTAIQVLKGAQTLTSVANR